MVDCLLCGLLFVRINFALIVVIGGFSVFVGMCCVCIVVWFACLGSRFGV